MRNKILSALVLSALLCGCSTIDAILSPSPNVVATLESTLAAADTAAMAYMTLPRCSSQAAAATSTPSVCSDSGVATTINTARTDAFTAVKAAEANETASTVQAAQNAITAFQALVPSTN